jgi:hypothetical protein
MLYYGAAEPFTVVSLDTYHRLRELERAWQESSAAGLAHATLTEVVEELVAFVSRDPVIKRNFSVEWEAIQPRLNSFNDRPREAIEATQYLASRLTTRYLRACRQLIIDFVNARKLNDKRGFRFLVENFCSFLLKSGHQQHAIYFQVQQRFLSRDIIGTPEAALHEFFTYFPCRSKIYKVAIAVNDGFRNIIPQNSKFNSSGSNIPKQCKKREPFSTNPQKNIFLIDTQAFDPVDARAKGEQMLTTLRATAYTVTPATQMEWDPYVTVWKEESERAIILREGPEVLRRARRRSSKFSTELAKRQKLFFDYFKEETDLNRLGNAVTTYASAFHSESLATQLLSLWSSLEGLLPGPTGSFTRISHFARDVVACYKKMCLYHRFEALYQQLSVEYANSIDDILLPVQAVSSSYEAKLAAIICLEEHHDSLAALQASIGPNPLARQRLYEIYSVRSSCGEMYSIIRNQVQKVEWQLYRIYRERNRIVHRASPSANVEAWYFQ